MAVTFACSSSKLEAQGSQLKGLFQNISQRPDIGDIRQVKELKRCFSGNDHLVAANDQIHRVLDGHGCIKQLQVSRIGNVVNAQQVVAFIADK